MWAENLRLEILELFVEVQRLGSGKDRAQPLGLLTPIHKLNSGLYQAQLELLEALTVYPVVNQAARASGLMSRVEKRALERLLKRKLVEISIGKTSKGPGRIAALTKKGWKVLSS